MTTLTCISPIDGKVIATRETASATAIEAAVAAARVAQRDWAGVSLGDRAKIMLAALEHLRAANADVTVELARQMGRPVRYGGEFRSLEERVRYMVEIAPAALAPLRLAEKSGFRREIRRVPLGVVLVVAPWNYPYLTAVNTIVPGLMAGNAVLLKAASQTLLTGDRFQAAFDAAGLPKGLFQTMALSHDDTSKLIASGLIDHVSFTGSVAGGRSIEQASAGTFASTTLELGGKDPAYVRADANLAHAVENLVDGAFFNSGQSCCGIERIYVHDKLYKAFVDGFVAETNKYVLADPLDSATTLGPMAATRFADVVRGQTSAAVAKGAKALISLENFTRSKDGSPWLQPQVLVDVDHSMAVMTEESFGPVVGIMRVKDDAEAVRLMNDSPYGLTAAIWTADLDVASSLADQLDTGTVFANRCDYLDPALAWTGVKETGRGVSLSSLAYGALTQAKSLHLRAV
jgi:acyl-CoA reductase-like NAD-dependent aldehyde dehydrogenase